MNVEDFSFDLPEELIAQSPLPDRASSRLFLLNRSTGQFRHSAFSQITQLLQPGDVLVINDTRVIPARLFGVKRDTGAKAEVLLLKALGADRWEALVRPGKKLQVGAVIVFGAGQDDEAPPLIGHIEQAGELGARVIRFEYEGIFHEVLDQLGSMPLPPYIKLQLKDKDRYQTVYAKHDGSAAAPTAGLHFTPEILNELSMLGVHLAPITLHVGLGTFRPVNVDKVEEHRMHAEYYQLSEQAAQIINTAVAAGKRVVAVGTTSCRTLETVAAKAGNGMVMADEGWTDIFIYPGYRFQIVDALLTNFHLPKSTLLMLISAFAGKELVMQAYREAVEQRYRFFSFGDAMFIY